MKRRSLSRIESSAQRLVEGSFKRLFGEQLEPYEVAAQLARAMEDSQLEGKAADKYTILLNPRDLETLLNKRSNLAEELGMQLIRLARQAGIVLPTQPQVVLVADDEIRSHQISILADRSPIPKEDTTQVHTREAIEAEMRGVKKLDAYLIVAGRQHVPLDRPLLTIGRRIDNDIVLDSASTSRKHAQIRWRYGRFILYDLSQRGRTAVNDQPVTEHVLQPGDVIALSDTLIIYGEGRDEEVCEPMRDEEGQTLQLPKTIVD